MCMLSCLVLFWPRTMQRPGLLKRLTGAETKNACQLWSVMLSVWLHHVFEQACNQLPLILLLVHLVECHPTEWNTVLDAMKCERGLHRCKIKDLGFSHTNNSLPGML